MISRIFIFNVLPSNVKTDTSVPVNACVNDMLAVYLRLFLSRVNRECGFSSSINTMSAGITPRLS